MTSLGTDYVPLILIAREIATLASPPCAAAGLSDAH